MKAQSRFIWADIIRILAVYFILVLHSGAVSGTLSKNYFDVRFLLSPIPLTCIPLFVMLSGALLLGKKESAKIFFQKRFARLFLPWVFWTCIYTIYAIFTVHLTSISQIARYFFTQFESFWFLPMIVCLYILTPAIRIFVQNAKMKHIVYIIFLWFIGVSLTPYVRDSMAFPRQVDDGLVRQVIHYFGYFLLGYVLEKIQIKKMTLFAVSFILLGLFWTTAAVYMQTVQNNFKMVSFFYSYVSPSILILSVGIFMALLGFGRLLESKISDSVRNILLVVSTAALPVYFIHALLQLLLPNLFFKQLVFHTPLDSYFIALVLFAFSFAVFFVLYKIPVVKRLVA